MAGNGFLLHVVDVVEHHLPGPNRLLVPGQQRVLLRQLHLPDGLGVVVHIVTIGRHGQAHRVVLPVHQRDGLRHRRLERLIGLVVVGDGANALQRLVPALVDVCLFEVVVQVIPLPRLHEAARLLRQIVRSHLQLVRVPLPEDIIAGIFPHAGIAHLGPEGCEQQQQGYHQQQQCHQQLNPANGYALCSVAQHAFRPLLSYLTDDPRT